jgi:L-amino acid N-acyltransferase YncA
VPIQKPGAAFCTQSASDCKDSEVEYVIETMAPSDWPQVRSIYAEGISTGHATFETEPPIWERWDSTHLPKCRLVARAGDVIFGWAALSPVSSRSAYSGVAEVSIYVGASYRGREIGGALLNALAALSEQLGIWTLQAGIFPENRSSLALHKRCGFREIGTRERVGQLNGIWRDVVLLERRSRVVGISF